MRAKGREEITLVAHLSDTKRRPKLLLDSWAPLPSSHRIQLFIAAVVIPTRKLELYLILLQLLHWSGRDVFPQQRLIFLSSAPLISDRASTWIHVPRTLATLVS